MKQLQHLNKGLLDGFDSEGAVNQVAAPTFFNADVKAIQGKWLKDSHFAPQTSNEQPGDTWCPTLTNFVSQLHSFSLTLTFFSPQSLINVLLPLLSIPKISATPS